MMTEQQWFTPDEPRPETGPTLLRLALLVLALAGCAVALVWALARLWGA